MALTLDWLAVRDRKTRTRLLRTAWAATDHVLFLIVIFGFALIGSIPMAWAWDSLLGVLAINIIFFGAIASGLTSNLRDPAMTVIQVCTASTWALVVAAMRPEISHVAVPCMFVPLSYAALLFPPVVYFGIWAYISMVIAAAFFLPWWPVERVALATLPEQLWTAISILINIARVLMANAAVSRLRADLKSKNQELHDLSEKLADLASRDELTRLCNRREFMRLLQEEAVRSGRSRVGFCVAILDIDHFKQVNDVYGHAVGDAVLHEVGAVLDSVRRSIDKAARFGGEEFTMLFVGADLATAQLALERIRTHVSGYDWSSVAPGLKVTVSAGLADWAPDSTVASILSRADTALYEAKNAGRNRVRTAPSEPTGLPERVTPLAADDERARFSMGTRVTPTIVHK
ncbi:MAG: diguanylate cyclase/phosphodiesterase & domain with sensor [Paucimonas sp.]|nr:diguanylate cyclase/phosphodiesterase & domain with sensor [Paucimonas sp.]